MNLFDRIFGTGREVTIETAQDPLPTNVKKKTKAVSETPEERQKYRQHEDVRTLENSILVADTIGTWNREDLNRILRRVEEDEHLSSQWETRQLKTLKRKFAIYRKGESDPDDEATAILLKPWFEEFIRAALSKRSWGFALVEFGIWDGEQFVGYRSPKGRIREAVEVIDRDYVKPELGIVVHHPGDNTGLDFYNPRYAGQLLFIGTRQHGFLKTLAKKVLFKENDLENWSEWAEVFGMDIRVGKSDAEDDDLTAFQDVLKKLGASGWGVIDKEDVIEFAGTRRIDAYQVYKELAEYIDRAISKKVYGQDVVTNNTGQVVGYVGENVANLYGDADAKFVTTVINQQLFRTLEVVTGKSFADLEFRFIDEQSVEELTKRSEVDKNISEMGFQHDPDYINETYGTNVEAQQTGDIEEVRNQLKKLYID